MGFFFLKYIVNVFFRFFKKKKFKTVSMEDVMSWILLFIIKSVGLNQILTMKDFTN